MSRKFLSFTAVGQSSKGPMTRSQRLLEASSGGDEVMSRTQYTEDSEEEVDPLQVPNPRATLARGRKVSFSTPKGKEVMRRTRSPSPPKISESEIRKMMGEIVERIRRRDEWTGQAAEEIGMRLEDLSNEQRKTWDAISFIHDEAKKMGAISDTHIKRWHQDLVKLNQDLHLHQAKRELEIQAEQVRQRDQLMVTVKAQQEQQQKQQEIIKELSRAQQTWQNYVEKELPSRVLATVRSAQEQNPTHQEIEAQIAAMIRENQPTPVPSTNMLTKEAADELIAAALAQQAETNKTAMQKAIEEAAQKARETAGPSREEIQRMINDRQRSRR